MLDYTSQEQIERIFKVDAMVTEGYSREYAEELVTIMKDVDNEENVLV